MTTDQLKAELGRLDAESRADLALFLVDSLDSCEDADADQLWDAELQRRLEEIRSGTAAGRPVAAVMAELREKHS